MNIFNFPTPATYTKEEQYFLQAAQWLYESHEGKLRPEHRTQERPLPMELRFLRELQTPMEGSNVDLTTRIDSMWDCFKIMHPSLKDDNAWDLLNRQERMLLALIVRCYLPNQEDILAHTLKCSKRPEYTVWTRYEVKQAIFRSEPVDDAPTYIVANQSAITIQWHNSAGKLDRNIDLGPAYVNISRYNGEVTINHYNNGRRVRGHKDWVERCADSNPWLKYVSNE